MHEPGQVAFGLLVRERQHELRDAEAPPGCVDRHPHLAAEPGRDREARLPRGRAHVSLTGQRLLCGVAGARADELSRDVLGDSEAAAAAFGEHGDRHVVAGPGERCKVSHEVCVREHERPGRSGPLSQRERLSLAAPGQPEHTRSRSLRLVGRGVARSVVGDDHLRCGKLLLERRHRGELLERGADPQEVGLRVLLDGRIEDLCEERHQVGDGSAVHQLLLLSISTARCFGSPAGRGWPTCTPG